jgi:dethiobiotin synthetase
LNLLVSPSPSLLVVLMPRGLFITGTGTGVGKTYVAALIARAMRQAGKRVGVYKPVASGCEIHDGELVSPDAVTLWEAAGQPGSLEQVCPQRFAAPLAPHLAARAEGRRVDPELLRSGLASWREMSDIVIVEGAGGLMSPLADDDYNADLAAEFGYPLVVVSANMLGTINATLQTLITAHTYATRVSGTLPIDHGTLIGRDRDRESESEKRVPDSCLWVAGIVLNSPNHPADDLSLDSNAEELAKRCSVPLLAVVEHGAGSDRRVNWWDVAGGGE